MLHCIGQINSEAEQEQEWIWLACLILSDSRNAKIKPFKNYMVFSNLPLTVGWQKAVGVSPSLAQKRGDGIGFVYLQYRRSYILF